jgi:hypothetical protein
MTARMLYRVLVRLLAILLLVWNVPGFVLRVLTIFARSDSREGAAGAFYLYGLIEAALLVGIPLYLFTAPRWLEKLVASTDRKSCTNCGTNLAQLPTSGRCPTCQWTYDRSQVEGH